MNQNICKDKLWDFMEHEGPWQNEPTIYGFIDSTTKLHCMIRRHHLIGHLCGYVLIPKHYFFYGKNYDDPIFNEIDVHGGLTFADKPSREMIYLVKDSFYLGFDCAHYDDFSPFSTAFDSPLFTFHSISDYKTIDFVKEECSKLARQLFELQQTYEKQNKKETINDQKQ